MPPEVEKSRIVNRLCHSIVLSRELTIAQIADGLILTLLVTDNELAARATVRELVTALEVYFGVHPDQGLLDASLRRLTSAGKLVAKPGGGYEIAAAALDQTRRRIAESTELERAVREEWLEGLDAPLRVPSAAAELWRCLQLFTAGALLRHGAETALLLSPDVPLTRTLDKSLSAILTQATLESCRSLTAEVAEREVRGFFANSTPGRTKYLAQLLDGAFTLFALSVDEDTARYLRSKLEPLALFLDTNFIFGVLGLNEQADAQLAKELADLVTQPGFPFTVYYHQETLREIDRTLFAIGERLKERRWQQAISRAAIQLSTLTDIELQYHQLNAKHPTDPAVFMSKFERMDLLLADHGFKIFREPASSQETLTERATLVARYGEYIERRRPQRPKTYETLNHDMAVWVAVQDRRRRAKSVLDAGALFLSMDYYLYDFDWYELRKPHETATVVLPRQLLQLLRPFAASRPDFDRRFVETFAIPEIRSLGALSPETSSQVLSYLNSYADIGEETAIRILTSNMLSANLRGVDRNSPGFAEAIESALALDNQQLLEEKESLSRERENLQSELAEHREEIDRLRTQVNALQAERRETTSPAAAIPSTTSPVATETAELRRRLSSAESSSGRLRVTLAIVAGIVGLTLLVLGPQQLQWSWLTNRYEYRGLTVGAAIVWIGLLWAWVDPARRLLSIGTLAIGVGLLVIAEALSR